MLYTAPNATDYVGMMQYVETGINVPFAELSIIAIFIVSFMIFLRYGPVKSFASSSFISFLLGLFLFSLGILPDYFLKAIEILVALSVIVLYFAENN